MLRVGGRGAPRRWAVALCAALVLASLAAGGCRDRASGDGGTPAEPAAEAPASGPATGTPEPRGGAQPGPACPLDGAAAHAADLSRCPLAVSIDNHPDARPQSGLASACLVYELPVEGGMTRFLAFFLHAGATSVGPVRSARDYMIPLAEERGAVLCHIGGSPQAYAALAREKTPDLDDMLGAGAYWRITGRSSPHNLYTATASLWAKAAQRGWGASPGRAGGFVFAPPAAAAGGGAGGAGVGAPAAHVWLCPGGALGERVDWRYSEGLGSYVRSVKGAPQCAEPGSTQIAAQNLVVQFTDVTPIAGDREGRLSVRVTGEGRALAFSGGTVREARWVKPGAGGLTRLKTPAGEDIVLAPGATWVALVGRNTMVEWE